MGTQVSCEQLRQFVADLMNEFNTNIVGLIEVIASYTEHDQIEFETKVKPNA
jgi:hypothetical protein